LSLSMAIGTGARAKPTETCRLTPLREETVMELIMKFTFEETGASAVEYALLLAFITMVVVASITTLGTAIKGAFDSVKV